MDRYRRDAYAVADRHADGARRSRRLATGRARHDTADILAVRTLSGHRPGTYIRLAAIPRRALTLAPDQRKGQIIAAKPPASRSRSLAADGPRWSAGRPPAAAMPARPYVPPTPWSPHPP